MSLLPTSNHESVAQLCSTISICVLSPFDRTQHRSLHAQLGEHMLDLDDAEYEQLRPQLTQAYEQLKQWSAGHVLSLAKAMEARYA